MPTAAATAAWTAAATTAASIGASAYQGNRQRKVQRQAARRQEEVADRAREERLNTQAARERMRRSQEDRRRGLEKMKMLLKNQQADQGLGARGIQGAGPSQLQIPGARSGNMADKLY